MGHPTQHSKTCLYQFISSPETRLDTLLERAPILKSRRVGSEKRTMMPLERGKTQEVAFPAGAIFVTLLGGGAFRHQERWYLSDSKLEITQAFSQATVVVVQ